VFLSRDANQIKSSRQKLLQICSGFVYLNTKNEDEVTEEREIVYLPSQPKLDVLINDIQELYEIDPTAKILVFYGLTGSGNVIRARFEKLKLKYIWLKPGEKKLVDKLKLLAELEDNVIVLANHFSSGQSIDGLQVVNRVFFYEYPESVSGLLQAAYRIRRIGQTKNLFVNFYVGEHTVEPKIIYRLYQGSSITKSIYTSATDVIEELTSNKISIRDLEKLDLASVLNSGKVTEQTEQDDETPITVPNEPLQESNHENDSIAVLRKLMEKHRKNNTAGSEDWVL
jgi:SNF2 family DNA or RNA helicase